MFSFSVVVRIPSSLLQTRRIMAFLIQRHTFAVRKPSGDVLLHRFSNPVSCGRAWQHTSASRRGAHTRRSLKLSDKHIPNLYRERLQGFSTEESLREKHRRRGAYIQPFRTRFACLRLDPTRKTTTWGRGVGVVAETTLTRISSVGLPLALLPWTASGGGGSGGGNDGSRFCTHLRSPTRSEAEGRRWRRWRDRRRDGAGHGARTPTPPAGAARKATLPDGRALRGLPSAQEAPEGPAKPRGGR